MFVSFVRNKTPKVVSNLVEFFYFAFFFLFCSMFKLWISTFDSWKLFVFVFGICKCTYFDLYKYGGLKDKLFILCFLLNCKKKKNCGSKSNGNKYILKKKDLKKVQQKKLWIKVKRKQIYIEIKGIKKGVQHNFLLQFYLWFIDIYLQLVFS